MQEKAVKRFEKVTEQAQQIPAQFRSQTTEAADKARETYSELAVRGEKLVKRIRNQTSTKDLVAQAGNTVTLGKGAVTTVRKAAQETQHAAMATLATGRREAESVAESVQNGVKTTGRTGSKAAGTTVTAGDENVTKVKKSTASAERDARSAATSPVRRLLRQPRPPRPPAPRLATEYQNLPSAAGHDRRGRCRVIDTDRASVLRKPGLAK